MTNIEKYNDIFKKMFNVPDNQLVNLAYKVTAEWNSMAQIALVAEIEEEFNLKDTKNEVKTAHHWDIGQRWL